MINIYKSVKETDVLKDTYNILHQPLKPRIKHIWLIITYLVSEFFKILICIYNYLKNPIFKQKQGNSNIWFLNIILQTINSCESVYICVNKDILDVIITWMFSMVNFFYENRCAGVEIAPAHLEGESKICIGPVEICLNKSLGSVKKSSSILKHSIFYQKNLNCIRYFTGNQITDICFVCFDWLDNNRIIATCFITI